MKLKSIVLAVLLFPIFLTAGYKDILDSPIIKGTMTIQADLVPTGNDSTKDLGSSSYRFGDLYLKGDIYKGTDNTQIIYMGLDNATLGQLIVSSEIDTPGIADNDLFELVFNANDDASTLRDWGTIQMKILDATNDSKDSHLAFQVWSANTEITPLTITNVLTLTNGLTIDNATDTKLEINENSDEFILTFGSNTVAASSGDVTLFDFGTIDVGTDALDLSEGNITNGGTASFDQVQADASALVIGAGTETVAINSSDWDINTVGTMTGIYSVTFDNGERIGNGAAGDIDLTFAVDNATLGELFIMSTNDDANIADNDLFNIKFYALDEDSTAYNNWGIIEAKILDATGNSKDSHIAFKTYAADAQVTSLTLAGNVATFAYDAAAYWTATQADAGAVTFNSVSDGTAGFGFSDGVTITDAALTATTGRILKTSSTMNNAVLADGYGMVELDGTITGTSTGHVAEMSSWINIPSGTASAGNYVTPMNVGVWEDAAATITNAKIIFGARAQMILGDNDALTFPWSVNTNNTAITALYDVNNHSDLGLITNAGSDNGTLIPFARNAAGTILYIKLYTQL